MSHCKTCGREIRFVKTITGQSMPLDPEPSPTGIVQILANGTARVIPAEDREALAHVPRYTSHFATCPDAADFRAKCSKGKAPRGA